MGLHAACISALHKCTGRDNSNGQHGVQGADFESERNQGNLRAVGAYINMSRQHADMLTRNPHNYRKLHADFKP